MTPKRKRRSYKFTEKKHSKLAIGTLVTGAISGIILVLFLIEAFRTKGNASVYYGSMGILAMTGTAGSLVTSLLNLREDKIFKLLPISAVITNGIFFLAWVIVYLLGFKIGN
jgi:hypothetical protein